MLKPKKLTKHKKQEKELSKWVNILLILIISFHLLQAFILDYFNSIILSYITLSGIFFMLISLGLNLWKGVMHSKILLYTVPTLMSLSFIYVLPPTYTYHIEMNKFILLMLFFVPVYTLHSWEKKTLRFTYIFYSIVFLFTIIFPKNSFESIVDKSYTTNSDNAFFIYHFLIITSIGMLLLSVHVFTRLINRLRIIYQGRAENITIIKNQIARIESEQKNLKTTYDQLRLENNQKSKYQAIESLINKYKSDSNLIDEILKKVCQINNVSSGEFFFIDIEKSNSRPVISNSFTYGDVYYKYPQSKYEYFVDIYNEKKSKVLSIANKPLKYLHSSMGSTPIKSMAVITIVIKNKVWAILELQNHRIISIDIEKEELTLTQTLSPLFEKIHQEVIKNRMLSNEELRRHNYSLRSNLIEKYIAETQETKTELDKAKKYFEDKIKELNT